MCGCAALVAGGRLPPPPLPRRLRRRRRGSSVRAEVSPGVDSQQKKVTVAGAGWAGLAAAHHLVKQVVASPELCRVNCSSCLHSCTSVLVSVTTMCKLTLKITACFDDQGYDVTLLAAESGPTEEVGLRGTVSRQYTIPT